jgi:DNA polymerase-3 subunit epsilon
MGNRGGFFSRFGRKQWNAERIAVFDLETTGVDTNTARIVTASIATLDPGGTDGEKMTFTHDNIRTWLVNPGCDIPERATAIHGITTAHAAEHGAPPDVACREIEATLAACWRAGIPVCAYNATYDLTVLDRELRRHCGGGLVVSGPVIDPYVIDKAADKYRRGSRTLTATCAHYGVPLDAAHDATADAVAAGLVAFMIAARHEEIAKMRFPALHVAQAKWYRDQRADYAEYRRRIGKPISDVNEEWPLQSWKQD